MKAGEHPIGNEPVPSGNELHASNRNFSDFESLQERASFMVIDVDSTVVGTSQEPGPGGSCGVSS